MRFSEEPLTAILGEAVRDLEAAGKEVTEDSLLEAVKDRVIDRWQVREFLEKAERGKERGNYPGCHNEGP